jgi:CYTH domain-containing protein
MATGDGGHQGLEIERRYLLAGAPSAAQLAHLGALPRELEQVYRRREDDWVRRVRRIEEAGTTRYVATRKRDLPTRPRGTPGISREEIETDLTVQDYGRLVADADPERRVIRKTRHVIAWRRWTLELDVFSNPPGLVMLEVELDDPADVPELPAELAGRVVREVTEDPAYTNYGLSQPIEDASRDLRSAWRSGTPPMPSRPLFAWGSGSRVGKPCRQPLTRDATCAIVPACEPKTMTATACLRRSRRAAGVATARRTPLNAPACAPASRSSSSRCSTPS